MEVQGREEDFVPQTHVCLFRGLQESGIYLGENFYSWRGLCHPAVPSVALVVVA